MAKGKGGIPRGMGNAGMMRQQAHMQQKLMQMQKDIENKQEDVAATIYSASVGGGAVQASVNGKKELTELKISPEVLDPEDVEALQDMLVSAVNDALRQAEEAMDHTMDQLSGLNLGMFGL